MSDDPKSQVALVTGATQGIGRATALALSEAGFRVAVLARTRADVCATVREIESRGAEAFPVVADVANPDEVDSAFSKVVAEFSTLDVLVNNAGTGVRKPFLDTARAECDWLVDLNLRGLINCTRAALHHMQPQGRGCIVNIASRAARIPEPDMAVYSATKAGVVAFSLALARELDGTGLRIVTICPGPVDTQRLRRLAPSVDRRGWLTPQDVANAVLFLSSSLALRYNGAVLDLFQ